MSCKASAILGILLSTVLISGWAAGCGTERRAATTGASVSSTTQPVSATQPAAMGPEYLNVLEAVFRHQFDHNASGGQRNVDYFFLSLDGTDPPEELMARFSGQTPKVLPFSCQKTSPVNYSVSHKDLGGRGLIFHITTLARLDANTVDAGGGYHEAGLSGSGNIYRVERRDGKWTVTHDEMIFIK